MGVPLYRWMFYFMENPTKNNMRNHSKQHSGTLFCIFSAGVLEWAWHRLSRCRPLAPRQVASRRKNRRDGNLGKNGGFYGVFYGDLMMAKMVFFMAKMVVFMAKMVIWWWLEAIFWWFSWWFLTKMWHMDTHALLDCQMAKWRVSIITLLNVFFQRWYS